MSTVQYTSLLESRNPSSLSFKTPRIPLFAKHNLFCLATKKNTEETITKTAQSSFSFKTQHKQIFPKTTQQPFNLLDNREENMKLVWSPERASKAYLDTVKTCELYQESGVAELVSAMAAGWDAKFVVETWSQGGVVATSIGLAIASRHTGGRHVCVVPDEGSRSEYIEAMGGAGISPEVIVGEPEEVMGEQLGIDFLVVDSRRKEFTNILRLAKLSHRGAVLVCKNASSRTGSSFRWQIVLDGRWQLARSVFLPVGKGLDIAHVATGGGGSSSAKYQRLWIRHVDQRSGEEHVIRK